MCNMGRCRLTWLLLLQLLRQQLQLPRQSLELQAHSHDQQKKWLEWLLLIGRRAHSVLWWIK